MEPRSLPSFVHARAFTVHVFTATGAALALAALVYAVHGQWTAMFVCLSVALFVDGIDGTLARWFKVADVLPRWSGDVLDLVVDFVTYVFVPAFAIASGGLLPDKLALPGGIPSHPADEYYSACPDCKAAEKAKSDQANAEITELANAKAGRTTPRRKAA